MFSFEHFAYSPIPEWNGAKLPIPIEDDAILTEDGIQFLHPANYRLLVEIVGDVIYRFGVFEFDPAAGELRKPGGSSGSSPSPLGPRPLVSQPGEVISRERLRSQVWDEGTHVDFDRGLAYCLGQVRTALGDSADNPRFVETLPRRGYRFIAPVQADEALRRR